MVISSASGLNPNHLFRDFGMGSALHAASAGGYLILVHILTQAGAQLDQLDKEQNSPLILAIQNSHNDIVKYLIKAGANISLKVYFINWLKNPSSRCFFRSDHPSGVQSIASRFSFLWRSFPSLTWICTSLGSIELSGKRTHRLVSKFEDFQLKLTYITSTKQNLPKFL